MTPVENIKKIISDKGFKQCAVAEKAGLTKQQFNDLLARRKSFDVCYIVPICNALGVEPNDLFA